MKNKYDTSVVFLYATGREHLLPLEFRKQIPYSTISTEQKPNNFGLDSLTHSNFSASPSSFSFSPHFRRAKVVKKSDKKKSD